MACALLAFALGGCATPGPLHVYSCESLASGNILDVGEARSADVPSFVREGERVIGFAYDPFTDHFFLRLAPGDRIRVVDRPARAIKREFRVDGAATGERNGDLAVRPRDGHLFLLRDGRVVETTRLGHGVRTFALAREAESLIGIAFDSRSDRLLALAADGRRVLTCDLTGAALGALTLSHVASPSLAFDAEKRELYAPLRDRHDEIGIFDEAGKLVRTLKAPRAFVDVGPRSFVRVF
jgi:hypothetical protein